MIHEFAFAHIPQDARRARAWIASLAPLVEARLAPGATVPLGALHRHYHLGDAILSNFDGPAQTMERPERLVEAQGLDHLVLRTHASGLARITAGERAAEARPGDIVILDLARPMRIDAGPAAGVALYVPRRVLADPASEMPVAHGAVLQGDRVPPARLVAAHLLHLAACLPAPPPMAEHLLPATVGLCRALFVHRQVGGMTDAGDPPLVIAIRRFIEDNLHSVDVEALTKRFGMSRALLYRRFVVQGGISAYIRDRRLASAMRKLARPAAGRRPMVARLSYECGFADPRAFSRAFHRKYGLWPGEVTPAWGGSGVPSSETPPMVWLREL